MKVMLTILVVLSSVQALAVLKNDPYREEIRQLLIKNHHPLKDWHEAKEEIFQYIDLKLDSKGYYVRDVYCGEIVRRGIGTDSMPNGNQINVEHTWPQSKFPRRGSITQKADIHHLYPTNSRANSKRGNFPFGNFQNGHPLEDCPLSRMGYLREARVDGFEPPLSQKGNVARSLFYFSVRYNIEIPDYEEIVLRQWNLLDPVDAEEIERNNRIEKVQGNRNIFVDEPEYADLISNF